MFSDGMRSRFDIVVLVIGVAYLDFQLAVLGAELGVLLVLDSVVVRARSAVLLAAGRRLVLGGAAGLVQAYFRVPARVGVPLRGWRQGGYYRGWGLGAVAEQTDFRVPRVAFGVFYLWRFLVWKGIRFRELFWLFVWCYATCRGRGWGAVWSYGCVFRSSPHGNRRFRFFSRFSFSGIN